MDVYSRYLPYSSKVSIVSCETVMYRWVTTEIRQMRSLRSSLPSTGFIPLIDDRLTTVLVIIRLSCEWGLGSLLQAAHLAGTVFLHVLPRTNAGRTHTDTRRGRCWLWTTQDLTASLTYYTWRCNLRDGIMWRVIILFGRLHGDMIIPTWDDVVAPSEACVWVHVAHCRP